MAPFARDMGHVDAEGNVLPPFRWNEERRLRLRAKLDAVYFHLYGVNRPGRRALCLLDLSDRRAAGAARLWAVPVARPVPRLDERAGGRRAGCGDRRLTAGMGPAPARRQPPQYITLVRFAAHSSKTAWPSSGRRRSSARRGRRPACRPARRNTRRRSRSPRRRRGRCRKIDGVEPAHSAAGEAHRARLATGVEDRRPRDRGCRGAAAAARMPPPPHGPWVGRGR